MADDENNNDTPTGRYRLKPDVETMVGGYEQMLKRIMLGAAGVGASGVLGKLALEALQSGSVLLICSGLIIGITALVLMTLTMPIFVFAFAGLIGSGPFHGRKGFQDPYGIAFAVGAVLLYAALVAVLANDTSGTPQPVIIMNDAYLNR